MKAIIRQNTLLLCLLLAFYHPYLLAQDNCTHVSVKCKNSLIQQAGRSVNIVVVENNAGNSETSTAVFLNNPLYNKPNNEECEENNDVVSFFVLTAFHSIDVDRSGTIDALERQLLFFINFTVNECGDADLTHNDIALWPYRFGVSDAFVAMYSPSDEYDFVLFRFYVYKSSIPESWQLYLSGVDATGIITNPCYSIHHPYTKDTKVATSSSGSRPRHPYVWELPERLSSRQNDFVVVPQYSEGYIEQGSSGSALFSSLNYKVIAGPCLWITFPSWTCQDRMPCYVSLADIWTRVFPPYNYSFQYLLDTDHNRLTPGLALYSITIENGGMSP